MRITSSERSFRLCAFSVLSARICQAISRFGTTSAVIAFAPSRCSAASRWRPFGVQKPFSGAVMAITGSRKSPVLSITPASFLWCASERSRWNGVGSTLSIGSEANSTGFPPSGSR